MDSDYSPFTINKLEILMFLGKIFERMYTMEVKEFQELLIKAKQDLSSAAPLEEDYHRFMLMNKDICLRSQIDCISELSTGEKVVFEIKSRALAPIRYDLENYTKYLDYGIKTVVESHSSYELEYYDLIRGAFLKYFFQLKIGK